MSDTHYFCCSCKKLLAPGDLSHDYRCHDCAESATVFRIDSSPKIEQLTRERDEARRERDKAIGIQDSLRNDFSVFAVRYDAAHDECNTLRAQLAKAKKAIEELLRIHDWCIECGGTEGPLPQDVITKLAEMQIPAIEQARKVLADNKADALEGMG